MQTSQAKDQICKVCGGEKYITRKAHKRSGKQKIKCHACRGTGLASGYSTKSG